MTMVPTGETPVLLMGRMPMLRYLSPAGWVVQAPRIVSFMGGKA
jgi:hypothetical protein